MFNDVMQATSKYEIEVHGLRSACVYDTATYERVSPILTDVVEAHLYACCLSLAEDAGLNATQVRAAWNAYQSSPRALPWSYAGLPMHGPTNE
jgi:hypothetical protein